jgi:RAD51-like protein 1
MPKPTTAKDLLEKTMDQEAVYEQVRTIQQSSCQTQSTANDDERRSGSADRMDPLAFGSRLRFLPTGLSQLDEHLQGGIRLGTVTEIVGEAGVGKTQLGLQLCVMAARYNQGAIYVDTENKLPVPRLRQMGQEWRKRDAGLSCLSNEQQSQTGTGFAFTYNQGGTFPTPSTQRDLSASQASQSGGSHHMPNDAIGSFKSSEQLLDNLTVHTATSTKELLSRLLSLEDEILQRNQIASVGGTGQEDGGKYPVRLLIVDSIAAPMRRDFGTDSAPQRSVAIFQCAQTLKRLADQLHLAVVVINQVGSADLVGGAVAGGHRSARDLLLSYRAALGTSWYHCVSTRLVLETVHSHQQHSAGADANSPLMAGPSRQLSICKSHMTGYVAMPFAVSNMGIVD